MKKYKELMITTIVCLIPMAIGAYFYDQLPAQVPVHWDSAGPNGWASRAFACFGLPGILTGLNLLVQITMENDPKKKNYAPVLKVFFKWLIPVAGICYHDNHHRGRAWKGGGSGHDYAGCCWEFS